MNDSRPNIVLITTDQQRADSLSCYGSMFTHTPHLDRLAREGIRFDRAYCANSVCTPARASLFSGRYVSRHGVWNVGMNVPDDARLLSHHLAAAGYATHYVGKAHFQAYGGTAEQSAEARRDNPRYPAFQGPYDGFESIELALGHTTLGLLGHYGEWVRSQVSAEEFASFGHATRLSSAPFGCEAYRLDDAASLSQQCLDCRPGHPVSPAATWRQAVPAGRRLSGSASSALRANRVRRLSGPGTDSPTVVC